MDPLTKEYPFLTPYAFAENDIISNIDLDGLEKASATGSVFKAIFGSPRSYSNPKTPLDHISNGHLRALTYRSLSSTIFKNVFTESLPKKFIDNYV